MMVCIGKGILAGMLAAWILYQSVYGMVTVFIFIPLCIQREKKKRREQQKETLLLQFRDAMQSVAAALQAGIFHGECMAGEREGDDGTIWTGWDICRRTASDQSGGWNEPAN